MTTIMTSSHSVAPYIIYQSIVQCLPDISARQVMSWLLATPLIHAMLLLLLVTATQKMSNDVTWCHVIHQVPVVQLSTDIWRTFVGYSNFILTQWRRQGSKVGTNLVSGLLFSYHTFRFPFPVFSSRPFFLPFSPRLLVLFPDFPPQIALGSLGRCRLPQWGQGVEPGCKSISGIL